MSDAPQTSRALFAAAREDGPDARERDAVYRNIALATGLAAGAAAVTSISTGAGAIATPGAIAIGTAANVAEVASSAASAAATTATGASFGMKLLALGAAIGAASTALGVILAMTVVAPEGSRTSARGPRAIVPAAVAPGARLAQPAVRKRDVTPPPSASTAPSASTGTSAISTTSRGATADANAASSDLGEEARLVTAARAALVAGDPARALALVQATRKLSARSLEPEELGLEARALHKLGRTDDAAATELVLRRRYPDHALAH